MAQQTHGPAAQRSKAWQPRGPVAQSWFSHSYFACPNLMQICVCAWIYHWTKKLWKIRNGLLCLRPPGHCGPLGLQAAGLLSRRGPLGCWEPWAVVGCGLLPSGPLAFFLVKTTGQGIDLTFFYPLLLCKPPTVECGVLTLIILKELRNGHSRKQDVDKQDRTI